MGDLLAPGSGVFGLGVDDRCFPSIFCDNVARQGLVWLYLSADYLDSYLYVG